MEIMLLTAQHNKSKIDIPGLITKMTFFMLLSFNLSGLEIARVNGAVFGIAKKRKLLGNIC